MTETPVTVLEETLLADAVPAPQPEVVEEVPVELRKPHVASPEEVRRAFETGEYPYDVKMPRRAYEREKAKLQAELLKVQLWAQETDQRFVILFEGRDAAGKGGTIKRFMEHLNPRAARVVALNKPTWEESGQWYFQRYVKELPTVGEMVFYDRSWYNRAGVERVMGFCEPNDYLEFMRQAPELERMLVRSGIRLYKYWFSVTQDEQKRRFEARETDPLKRWKLSPIDVASRTKYAEYSAAREAMFKATHTAHAPWTVVDFNDQKHGRLTLIRDLLDRLPDTQVPDEELDWPTLGHEPLSEDFGFIKPVAPFPLDD